MLDALNEYQSLGIAEQIDYTQSADPIKHFADPITERLYQAVLKDNGLNYAAYGTLLGVSEATVKRRLGELKAAGYIIRAGSNKSGHWEVLK
ncbi:MAG: winged helix-turn-helix domain-containing protein [Bacteroidales bacterium]|nr:winged helix-turn-helix domain-containing protein [Bacteroidales bacterium]MDY6348757.1 winged helix-turn-helix domain-containing protein [Bacteroidales bacterium]